MLKQNCEVVQKIKALCGGISHGHASLHFFLNKWNG